MQFDDTLLLERATAGDADSFGLLYRRYHATVLRFAVSLTGSASTAEDIAHDVFAALLARPARFDPGRAALGTYLFAITRNLVSKHRRDTRTRAMGDADAARLRAAEPDPRAVMEDRERVALMRRLLAALPERERAPLLLCDLHDIGYAEAAQLLGTTTGALRHRLRSGRQSLRRALHKSLPTIPRLVGNHKRDSRRM